MNIKLTSIICALSLFVIAKTTAQGTINRINFTDLYSTNVVATTGTFDSPFQSIGVVDYGYLSAASRHTIHNDTTEYDNRTGGLLKTVPDGSPASVRLGNWESQGQAESITYSYTIDTSSSLLLIQYAAVLEGASAIGINDESRFKIEILDQYGQAIDVNCLYDDFIAGYNTLDWDTINAGASGRIYWKDWTTIGYNLQNYTGETIKIRFTTYDCSFGGHFGYAYFTLDCVSPEIKGNATCTTPSSRLIAPEGFIYEWYREYDPATVISTNREFIPVYNDTSAYVCRLTSKPGCFFTIEASTESREVVSQFSYTTVAENCKTRVNFQNTSYTQTASGKTGKCENFYWIFGNGTTSYEENPSVVFDNADAYQVFLSAGIENNTCTDNVPIQL